MAEQIMGYKPGDTIGPWEHPDGTRHLAYADPPWIYDILNDTFTNAKTGEQRSAGGSRERLPNG